MVVVSHAFGERISSPLRRRAAPAQVGLLDRVLGVGHAAQHAIGDGEEERTMLEKGLAAGHAELRAGNDAMSGSWRVTPTVIDNAILSEDR